MLLHSLAARLRRSSLEHKAIMHSMSCVAFFLLLAKLIAALKEMLVAYCYGTSHLVDGYLFTFNLTMWPVSVFYSLISFVLIPHLVRMRAESPDQEALFRREVFFVTIAFAGVMTLITVLVLFKFVESGSAGLSARVQSAALLAIPWLSPIVVLGCLAALFSTWLMSERRHANTFLESMPALCVALMLLICIVFDLPLNQSVMPLVVGTLLGFLVQFSLLAYLSCGGNCMVRSSDSRGHWRALRGAIGAVFLSQVVMAIIGLVDQLFLVRMGEGVLAIYSYAQRVMALILGLSATVIGRALLPVLSSVVDMRRSWYIAKRWAFIFGAFGAVGSVFLCVLAKLVVKILFERGAFTAVDTMQVSAVLVVLGMQLPFYLFCTVVIQWVYAIMRQRIMLAVSILGLLAKMIGAVCFYDMGAVGLALSSFFVYLVMAVASFVAVYLIVK